MPVAILLIAWRQPEQLLTLTAGQWDLLLRQADSAHLMAALWYRLEELALLDQVPTYVREQLNWAHMVSLRHGQAVDWEVQRIAQALGGLVQPLILLKGAAYRVAGRACAHGRLFSDIDILVPEPALAEVEAALMLAGWCAIQQDDYDQRYYRQWMHELPPMQHARRGSVIDVHHAILPKTAAAWPDPAMLRAAALTLPGQPGLAVLAPMDMLLHSAAHLFYDGEFNHGLRDLIDIHSQLLEFGPESACWDQLSTRASALQLERPLFYALRYCQRLLRTPLPERVMAAAQRYAPPAWRLLLMDGLFERALQPDDVSCHGARTGIARFLLYIRGNWLRMPALLLARHLLHKAFLSPKKDESPVVQLH